MLENIYMFNCHLIVLGKYKEEYWQAAEAEYSKRLKPYAKLIITEINEERFSNIEDRETIQKKEAEKILKAMPDGAFVIACDENGKELASVEFANLLVNQSGQGQKICFILGGPLGLHKSIIQIANLRLSLSQMTFPHQLARVILLEQIYRAATIANQKQYHY